MRDLCYCGRAADAVRLLCDSGVRVEPRTYALLLQECINRKEFRKGRVVHGQMVVSGYVPNEFLKTKLLIFYMKSGNMAVAEVFFGRLVDRTLISWNSMIAGYVQAGECDGIALDLFYQLRWSGLVPDQYTFASIFRACSSFATLEHGKRAHCVLMKCPIRENVVVSSALLDMYFKCSNVPDGKRVFEESSERNVVTWTALISGYGLHGMAAEVLDCFREMVNGGFRPNYVTFLAVLSACCHRGMVDEGWEYFTSMNGVYGIQPRRQHYAAMVDLLGRAGRLEEASQLIMKSPCKEHPVIWGALLESCRTYGVGDLLQHAAKKYFELEPENAGKYVVLCNAYATFGFWDNVAAVRKVMRDSGMAKEPAYSRIEVKAKVHFFFKGDNSHEESERILAMAKDIQNVLRDITCLPEIGPSRERSSLSECVP
ncbi:hypothetical protein MLD38_026232 [Melastoma candidum]|uniref:Uncharacterized protein n=1 Tax=Melastoma candidum TaxID=119954 RepID=A0ACB9NXU0_9MYRT|nr:hypothetical protein MLD38_026232 [Melastoma candidum]